RLLPKIQQLRSLASRLIRSGKRRPCTNTGTRHGTFPSRAADFEAPGIGGGHPGVTVLMIFGTSLFNPGRAGQTRWWSFTVLARRKPGQQRQHQQRPFSLNLSIRRPLLPLLFCIPFQSTVYMCCPPWVLGEFHLQIHPRLLHRLQPGQHLPRLSADVRGTLRGHRALPKGLAPSGVVTARAARGGRHLGCSRWPWPAPVAHHQSIVESKDNSTFLMGNICIFLFVMASISAQVLNHLHKKLRNVSKKSEASKKKTAQTVLVVVVVFCLSWLPHHVVHLWVEFGSFPLNQASFLFRVAAHCLAYSNSSVNPIIYAFLSENFRQAYKQVFRCQAASECPVHDARELRNKMEMVPSTNCTTV
ncbi:hypothetical protein NFI96_027763, partial [Prochilodus magdalenae]